MTSLRVLLVEDREEDYVLTKRLLLASARTTFKVTWARSYDEAIVALHTPYDVCIVDYHLGQQTGLDEENFTELTPHIAVHFGGTAAAQSGSPLRHPLRRGRRHRCGEPR